ncbi:MAG TPA: hypothetical protein PLL92_16625, partial [Alicycliphilus sp.]|nr:hypothetical protein [Alicycliphilus sp.]
MRRVLSLALVMLLLVRGLLGDAMAMGLAPMPAVPPAAQAVHAVRLAQAPSQASHDGATMVQDCCDYSGHSQPAHQAGCGACGICHAALAMPAWAAAHATGARHSPQPPSGTR